MSRPTPSRIRSLQKQFDRSNAPKLPQPPFVDKRNPITGQGQVDIGAPQMGVGPGLAEPLTGLGGKTEGPPTGTPFARPVKK
jgi:hypothetical protein